MTAGSYATCLAEGYIKLGFPAFGKVTADVLGAVDSVSGYVETHASLILLALRDHADFVNAEIDLDSFAAIETTQPAVCGLFLPAGDELTITEFIETVAASAGLIAGDDGDALFRLYRLEPPTLAADWSFDSDTIHELDGETLPYGVPWRFWEVGYQRNWTPQAQSELVEGVPDDRKAFLESEYRWVIRQDASIALAHRTSSSAPARRSLFNEQADAEDEADRLAALYSFGRSMYRVVVRSPAALFRIRTGETVRLQHSRFNLTQGRNFVVIAAHDDLATKTTELLVFG